MMQTQWPGLGPIFQSTFGGSALGGGAGAPASIGSTDGVSPSWWGGSTAGGYGQSSAPTSSSTFGLLQSIFGLLGQLLGTLMNGTPFGGTCAGGFGQNRPLQSAADLTLSSTGDPHLAETGTINTPSGTQTVDDHFDSMTSQRDLIDTPSIAGGYRVSTNVTQPAANGVTWNDSATVHANFDQDHVTMNRDGSFAISDAGQAVSLAKGQSVTLSGGETVSENQDGSLVVAAANGYGGTISTTLRATGSGVDVTTQAHQVAVGGDIVREEAPAQPQPGHHGHHHRQPVTLQTNVVAPPQL